MRIKIIEFRKNLINFGRRIYLRSLFVGFIIFIRKFPGWYAGGRVITITHYTHFNILFSQIIAKLT